MWPSVKMLGSIPITEKKSLKFGCQVLGAFSQNMFTGPPEPSCHQEYPSERCQAGLSEIWDQEQSSTSNMGKD